jgi:hypothetical protein
MKPTEGTSKTSYNQLTEFFPERNNDQANLPKKAFEKPCEN